MATRLLDRRGAARKGAEPDAVAAWRARLTPVMVDGLRTHVLDEGMGDPVVMLHGIPTQAYLWRDVARVVSRERRAIAPDLLGFGLADKPLGADLSPAGQATFLESVLRQLGVEQFALVAHDYGALVAAALLRRMPERVTHVVIANTSLWKVDWFGSRLSPFALLRLPAIGEAAFLLAQPFMLKQAFSLYSSERSRWTRDTLDVYWQPFREGFGDVLLRLARESRLTDADFHRYREAFYDFPRPALVVWGAKDPTFREDRGMEIAKLFGDGHFERFQHASHYVPEDRPDALGRLIEVFLDGKLER